MLIGSSVYNPLKEFKIVAFFSASVNMSTARFINTIISASFGPVTYDDLKIFVFNLSISLFCSIPFLAIDPLFLLDHRYMPAQMRADTWAQFPLVSAIPWNGVDSLVVEISYQNQDQRSPTGAIWMNAATYPASVSSMVDGVFILLELFDLFLFSVVIFC